jgi:site-specific recombinase XerD
MQADHLYTRVCSRLKSMGLGNGPRGPHGFRHAFASRLLDNGHSIKTIADMLGHRDINSTFIYTKVDFRTLEQVPLDWLGGGL